MNEYIRGSKVEIAFYVMFGIILGFGGAMILSMAVINHLVGMLLIK